MESAAEFFNKLWMLPIKRKCLENPIMLGHAKKLLAAGRQSQIVHPWMFGHLETKATCLWLDNLPNLVAKTNLKTETMTLPSNVRQRLFYLPPSPTRWKERSTTYQGIANAMAEQWGP